MVRTTSLLQLVSVVGLVWSCSPEGYREIHMDEMAHGAIIIAYGKVTNVSRDKYLNSDKAYDVEFEVKCTYKGGQIPSKITISEAGYFYGMCGDKNFTLGIEYLAFLKLSEGKYTQIYDQTTQAEASMEELMTFCGLHLDYPVDSLENKHTCSDIQRDASSCHRYSPSQNSNRPTEVNRPMTPEQIEDIDDNSGDTSMDTVIVPSTSTMSSTTTTATTTSATTTAVSSKSTLGEDAHDTEVGSLRGSGVCSVPVLYLLFSVAWVLLKSL